MDEKQLKTVLDQAAELVAGDRQRDYGNPVECHKKVAVFWSEILGTEVTWRQVALCMMALKIARLSSDPTHRDSVVDVCGYAHILSMPDLAEGLKP